MYSPGVSQSVGSPASVPLSSDEEQERHSRVVPYVATAVAAVLYSILALRRVWELKAHAFDAGFLDNVLFKVSAGMGDVSSLTGVPHFVDHTSVLLLGAVPVYWINPDLGYPVLLVLQAISVSMVGLAAWLVADAIGLSRGHRYAVLLYVFASPAAYWAVITELHMTGLAMGLVAMTVAGAYRHWRLSAYWILPLLASLARLEIAVTIVIVGLLLLGVSKRHARTAIVAGVAVAVLMVTFMFLAPDRGSSVGAHLDYLGIESISQLPLAMLQQPGAVLRQLFDPVFLGSILIWFVMVGTVLPLRAPRWFLIGVPMLMLAAIGSPRFADLWYQHYWNLLLVGAAIAFVLSLAIWSFSDRIAIVLVLAAMATAWMIAGPVNGPPQFKILYPSASVAEHQIADLASSTPGVLSTTRNLVLPAARREWIHEFPNPFVCRSNQYAYFSNTGPAPDVVITRLGWEVDVASEDIHSLRRTLRDDYEVVETIGTYTVRRRVPGTSPALVAECDVVPAD